MWAQRDHDVIVADDSPLMRDLLRSYLDRRFANVYLAKSGPEAVELARKMSAALVLLDYKMPRMDGLETCREIRLLPDYRSVPIILITGWEDEKPKRDAKRAGATLVMRKPISMDQLFKTLDPLFSTDGGSGFAESGGGLAHARDRLSVRRQVEAATEQRRYWAETTADRSWPPRDPWSR